MATVKVKFRSSSVPQKEGSLFYQVIHQRKVSQFNSGYKIYPHEWDDRKGEIICLSATSPTRHIYLHSILSSISDDLRRLNEIITFMRCNRPFFTVKDITDTFATTRQSQGFILFGRTLVSELRQIDKIRTAERYTTVLNSFHRFCGDNDVPLHLFDSALMMRYETFLCSKGVCPNTTSFYMRGMRALYNRAVEKGIAMQRNPFRHVYTGIDKTVKRAIPLKVIRQIKKMDLTDSPTMELARDLFMFSFYTRGMSFIDMAYLKKKDLRNGIISYRRHKTAQLMFIKWEKPMQEIIDKHPGNPGNPYLLPIINRTDKDERHQYKNAAHNVNCQLKKIGMRLNLPITLTSYVARHAWASIAKSQNIPIATISEAMGHDSERTTRIYLASLDTSAVDKANVQILKSLL